MKRITLLLSMAVLLMGCASDKLPRGKASEALDQAFAEYLATVEETETGIHSIMILQHGKVLEEHFFVPDTAHVLHSVSKTFTATAVGFAIEEGLLSLDDRIVDLFPECVPDNPDEKLSRMTVRNLLTMNSGHGKDPTGAIRNGDEDWVRQFMALPIDYEPGTCYTYNSLGTYVLSAAVQKVKGQKIETFSPLCIGLAQESITFAP